MPAPGELRVFLLPATRRDGAVACEMLSRAGIDAFALESPAALSQAIASPIGALVVADTALRAPAFGLVLDALAQQASWSDLPVVLMSSVRDVDSESGMAAIVQRLTNVTLIDRPTSVRMLLSAVHAALRARRRQYQIRDQLAALRQADEALRLADRRKDEFLATLAHELRNPLAPLRSALQIMEMAGSKDPQQARLISMMERQMNVMVRLIDDLLDVARISSGKVTLQRRRIDLRSVAEVAIEAATPAIVAAGHHLEVDMPGQPAYVMGDATRLSQVIGNLLNNATKYTPPGGDIHLGLAIGDDAIVVAVRDNGAGIPSAVLKHVFDMFAQVNRTLDRAQGGLGIGLALVRRLLDMHGGTIEAQSEGIDRGSVFIVKLPRLRESAPSSGDEPARDHGAAAVPRFRLLVIDDNKDAADTLALLLELAGHDVRTAYDGPSGIAAARAQLPHAIFCDLGMPGMSGHEVAATLRGGGVHPTAALIAVTGWGADEDRRKAQDAGFDFHLVKPVDATAIGALLEKL